LFDRVIFPGFAGLLCLGLLAACGKPAPVEAPGTDAMHKKAPCLVPRTHVAGESGTLDEELFSASAAGDAERADQLIGDGANVNATGALKRTPLFAAAFCDRPELAKLLLDKGGTHNTRDASGISPLHAAVIIGSAEVARILIVNGADINIRDATGRTPLHLAAATNQISLVELLLKEKANTAVRDRNGMTASSLARDNGHSMPADVIQKWQERQAATR